MPKLESMLVAGPVFLDAVYCQGELDCYRRLSVPVHVLSITTERALRVKRLASRDDRSMSEIDLGKRDELELATIGLGEVMAQANAKVRNDCGLDQFKQVVGRAVTEFLGFPT